MVAEWIERRCCERIAPSAGDAALALLLVERASAPRRVRNRLSRLLLEAIEREPAAASDPEIARALQIAKRRVKPRKSAAKRSPKTRKRKNVDAVVLPELEAFRGRS